VRRGEGRGRERNGREGFLFFIFQCWQLCDSTEKVHYMNTIRPQRMTVTKECVENRSAEKMWTAGSCKHKTQLDKDVVCGNVA